MPRLTILATFPALLLLAAPAMAQEPARPATVVPPADPQVQAHVQEPPPLRFSLTARSQINFSTGFEDAPGDLTVSRAGAEFASLWSAGERARLRLALDYEFNHYDFRNATGFAGIAEPWEDVHRLFLSAMYSKQATRQLAFFVGGSFGFSAEDGADLGKSLAGSAFGGVKYYLSENFSIGTGIGVQSQIEDNWIFLPVPLIEWTFAPGWSIESTGRPGVNLVWQAGEQVALSLGAAWESRDFRLAENGPVPDGVGRERQVPVTFGVKFQPRREFEVGAALGVNFARNYRLDDENGNQLADIDADPNVFLGFQFVYRF